MNTILINGLHFPETEKHYQTLPTELSDFDKTVFKWLNKHTKNTYIDVGGHVGTTVLLYGKLYKQIHVFEPCLSNFQCLKLNTAHLSNVEYYNTALGEKDENGYYINDGTQNSGSVCLSREGCPITIKTLDSFNIQNVSYIKIDTQGYDLNVLKGALQTIRKNIPILNVEDTDYLPQQYGLEPWGAKKFLNSIGYRQVAGTSKTFLFVPKRMVAS